MKKVLIVGCGFAGSVYAAHLAENGIYVDMIDQRDHIGGNAFDYTNADGIRIHKYGPHLFHTNNLEVVDWLRRFGTWIPYEHKVRALLDNGSLVPLPVNKTTIERVFDVQLKDSDDTARFLESISDNLPGPPRNAAEHLYSKIGRTLTDLFFRPYTMKMWDTDLEDMSATVVARLALKYDDNDLYFPNDKYQMLPLKGYHEIFRRMLDHPFITVNLNTKFDDSFRGSYDFTFNSMPIDEYFQFDLGELPYRSIRFHHMELEDKAVSDSVVNYTDNSPFTRETRWHLLPSHSSGQQDNLVKTIEEPCDYRDNAMERYYPIKTSDDRYSRLYKSYHLRANTLEDMEFIGRCGTYQYLDMHQVINQSLQGARKWLRRSE